MVHHVIVLGISGSGANVRLHMSLDAVHVDPAIFIQQVDIDPIHWDVYEVIPSTLSDMILDAFLKDDGFLRGTIEFDFKGCNCLVVCLACC